MPNTENVLEVKDVSMKFNIASEKVDNIKEYIIRRMKNQLWYREFYALQEIALSMKKGDSLALIGLNGSGKSTLLKIIAGVLNPTQGSVTVNGRIAPLIELGAGFDMDLTATENVWISGAIMGYSRKEMKKYYDEIVAFAELEEFMDVPVKNFSSGMLARLAFAVTTFRTPEILIVDEVLSVGDFKFQRKCEERIRQIKESGAAILFVSHNMEQVKSVCEKAIWLEKGRIKMQGDCESVIANYQREGTSDE